MILCVTSEDKTLDAKIDPRFGRCKYFIIYNTETKQHQAIENPNAQAGHGAGTQAGQLMAKYQVELLLTGNIGPNAATALEAAGVKPITGVVGSVAEAIEKYQ